MRHFGIIGRPLGHSFSATYFTEKFSRESIDADYRLFPLDDISEAKALLETLDGFSVTLPYKQAIIPLLDGLDETAAEIGAVNVVYHRRGYNTDCIGFIDSLRPCLTAVDRRALVLGTGGVSKAVVYGLRQLGLTPTMVSRDPQRGITYEQLTQEIIAEHTVIVNCTPLGMFPETDKMPLIPYEYITTAHLLFDCIYNPPLTEFLRRGQETGARICNGNRMLIRQAEAAWEIWNV